MTDIKRILVPVDGSETSDRAIEEAIKIAEVYNSDIHILYVANINQLAINACLSDAILEAVTKAGNEILEKAANKVPEKINVITTSETGSPSVTITDFADEIKADLVVIGSVWKFIFRFSHFEINLRQFCVLWLVRNRVFHPFNFYSRYALCNHTNFFCSLP